MADENPDIPPKMQKVYRRLKRWRSSHARRVPIPESLWAAAGEVARAHGVNPTAKALHLEYGKLKQRAEAAAPAVKRSRVKALAEGEGPRRARRTAPPTFVELMAPPAGYLPGAVVELEGPRGRMRIELKGVAREELVALSRALWNGGA
jgi:hypothetical protein